MTHSAADGDDLGEAITAEKIAAQCADLRLELLGGILDLAEAAGVLDSHSDADRQLLQ
jgi:hypothetical protein